MGAGLALEFALRYPNMYKDYQEKCEKNEIAVGCMNYYYEDGKVIVNFPTKWHFKYPSKIEWIENGLKDFIITYKKQGITSVAFPKLGTLNGGLEWEKVKNLMEEYLSKIDIPVFICLDEEGAEGLEKDMLQVFHKLTMGELKNVVKLTQKQQQGLMNKKNFYRFWQIKEVEGIGITTYAKIFQYCKKKAEGLVAEQLNFFEL
jgi:O-acetyl-ADP-ribose deacetylase (regulator of RNase III)